MALLDSIKDKAQSLLNKASTVASRKTVVYDASKNRIIVAGLELDGVVKASLSSDVSTVSEQGLDRTYYTYYDVIQPRKLVVDVLPTAKCNALLERANTQQKALKGWLTIAIYENGEIINVFRGHIEQPPEIDMQQEANDRQYTFGITTVSMSSNIDQPKETNGVDSIGKLIETNNTIENSSIDENKIVGEQQWEK